MNRIPAAPADSADAARIAGYLDCLKTQRKLSPHTLDNYGRDLRELLAMLDGAALAATNHAQVRNLTARLHARGLNARSIARKLSAWRGFFGWLAEQMPLPSNPVDGVTAPKRAKTLPQALGADDAVRLVSSANPATAADSATRLCNRAMFELLYSSGLRASELVGLDVRYAHEAAPRGQPYTSSGWIDLAAQDVIVTGKGRKVRSVPVGRGAMLALQEWIAARAALVRLDPHPLFLNERGSRISVRTLQIRIKAQAQALGIPANVHPHMLRHSFASHLLQSSGDLRAVQEMLGHESLAATQIYTALDFQRLASVYDAAHPRAKKKSPDGG
ncbi:tyrosine recombinase XerC [Herminiimonas sp. CN]|uniref:tyrosine recombinase XerC n=1 Tax=Herminiimonas sp. CN TaxID=1349818 RepID=UPI0004736E58|nr:tyrosine recombinase XerC [Herminiimonas sp. CN]